MHRSQGLYHNFDGESFCAEVHSNCKHISMYFTHAQGFARISNSSPQKSNNKMMMTSKWSQGEKSWARIIWNSSGTDMTPEDTELCA